MTVFKKEDNDRSETKGTQVSAHRVVVDFPLIVYMILVLASVAVGLYYRDTPTFKPPAPASSQTPTTSSSGLLSPEDAARGYLCVAFAIAFGIVVVALDRILKTCLGHRAEMKKTMKGEWLEGRKIGINERRVALDERRFYHDYESRGGSRAPASVTATSGCRWSDMERLGH